MADAVIVATARSPIGWARAGSLANVRPDELTATIVRAALDQVPELDRTVVDDLILGCGQPGDAQRLNPGPEAATLPGCEHPGGTVLARSCSSSLQSIRMAHHAIQAGEGEVFVCAGVEMPSRPTADTDTHTALGESMEGLAERRGITREAQDEFSARSQTRAQRAAADGFWKHEITPVATPDGTVISADDGPRPEVTPGRLAELPPAFRAGGTVTAGNCAPPADGAAAALIASDTKAAELGVTPLARVVSSGLSPPVPGSTDLGPVQASRQALARAGMGTADIDLVEINEAFAAQMIPSYHELGMDIDKLNPHGGAIALGNPFGTAGARVTTTLVHGLRARDVTYGLAATGVADGEGMAVILERLH